MNVCWLVSNDKGGGVVSVALSCVRQAAAVGHHATLLLVHASTGWLASEDRGAAVTDSLALDGREDETPAALLRWLAAHPQDVIVFNNCDEAEPAIPYLPPQTRCIYAVHDTAKRYWTEAIQQQSDLDGVVPVSQIVADRFRDQWLTPETLRVIHAGSFFPPPPTTTDARAESILFCGGDNAAKGTGDLVELWTRLAREDWSGELHWFGGMAPDFEERVRALPGAERIRLHGRRPRAELFEAAGRCRVFLMLSRVEAFGMVTIEAMSMGCVPVAWDIATGTREVIRAGETGWFAPLGDYDALAAAVKSAMQAQPVMGPAAMQHARAAFADTTMWRNYAAFLDVLADRPRLARSGAGGSPPAYHPPRRYYQLLPARWRSAIRTWVGRCPRLGYLVRDCRGW